MNRHSRHEHPSVYDVDRRVEHREPADGIVELRFVNGGAEAHTGQLVDISENGFRAIHDFERLQSGDVVVFNLPGRSGRARVVWNRHLGHRVESGFWMERSSH